MKKILFALVAAFALYACSNEDFSEAGVSPEGKIQLVLNTGDFTQVNSRAVAEGLVKDITLLQFKKGTLVQKMTITQKDFTQAVTLTGTLEEMPATATKDETDMNGDERKVLDETQPVNLIYAVANVADNTAYTDQLVEGTTTFETFKGLQLGYDKNAEVLPMVGYYYGGIVPGATNQIDITLYRVVAKINFTLNYSNFKIGNETPGITVNSVKLMGVPKVVAPYPCANRPGLPRDGQAGKWPQDQAPFPAYSADNFEAEGYGDEQNQSATAGTYTFYMPENVRGSYESITSNTDKHPAFISATEAAFTHILVDLDYSLKNGVIKNAKYKIYLGGDAKGDMNLLRNTQYNVTTYLYGATEETRITVTDQFNPEITPADGQVLWKNANCYIVDASEISDKKLGGNTVLLPLTQARLGWNYIKASEGKDELLTAFDNLVKSDKWAIKTLWASWDAEASDATVTGKITGSKATITKTDNQTHGEENYFAALEFDGTFANGHNAVIALVDTENEDKIYWSWHLWFTDYNPDATGSDPINGAVHDYFGAAFQEGGKYDGKIMMDRNLGATIQMSATLTAVPTSDYEKYFGMLYQFGRKDPFTGSANNTTGNTTAATLYGAEIEMVAAPSGSNLSNAVHHPTKFYTNSGNWTSPNEDLWASEVSKSPFDPCPAGWRVPTGGTTATNNVWAGFKNGVENDVNGGGYVAGTLDVFGWDGTARGRLYKHTDAYAWYPACGYRGSGNGTLSGVGGYGYYWSAMPYGGSGYNLYFYSTDVNPANYTNRAGGFPVRCVKE